MKLRLCLFAAILLNTFGALAATKVGDLYYNLNFENKTAEVSAGYYNITSIQIPEEIVFEGQSYSVTSIGYNSFGNCQNLSNIDLPQSLKSIGEIAFWGCSELTELTIPDGVETIGSSAFLQCTKLTTVKLPNALTILETNLFQDCSNLSSIVIPSNVVIVKPGAFNGCNNLISVDFPSKLEIIDNWAFNNCSSLLSIDLPQKIVSVGNGAFEGCTNLCSVEFEGSYLSYLGDHVFKDCIKLKQISLPEGINKIDSYSFYNCQSLEFVSMPYGLTSIGKYAFYSCSKLSSLDFPSSLISIDEGAFSNCTNLSKLNLNNGLKTIGKAVFTKCPSIKTIILPPSLEEIGWNLNKDVKYFLFNGNIKLAADPECDYYILSSSIPNITSNSKNSARLFFLTSQEVPGIDNSQINSALVEYHNLSFDYTGEVQNLEQISFVPEFYDSLNSVGISFSFLSGANIKCGEYSIGNISFNYKSFESIVHLDYKYTINPVPLQIIAIGTERSFGENDPELKYELRGIVNGEEESTIFSKSPIIKSSANINSPVGEYRVLADGAEAENYIISYIPGILKVTKAPLTLTVNDATRLYGQNNPPFDISYEGFKLGDTPENALTELPTISTEATVKSSVGVYAIRATGCVAKNYEVKEYIPGNLTITKAPLTLTVKDVNRNYYSENPTFEYTLTGLVNNDDESCITTAPTFSCQATVSSNCGQYPITAFGADAKNYNITYKEGMLNILPILLTLIPIDATRYYGEENPDFSFYAENLKGDDTIENALSKSPIITTPANESSVAGEYPLTIAGGEAKNYTLNYGSGKLSVSKAPLRVTALDTSRKYGEPNPKFAIMVEGLKLGESEGDAFFEMPSATTDANLKSDAGVYPLVATGGTAENYEITDYIPGKLTVTKAPLSLTAIDANRKYGTGNPSFDYELNGLLNDDDKTCLTKEPEFACEATLTSDCGEYDIVPSKAEAKNYDITYNSGKLTVSKSPLSISVVDVSREYGDANPQFEFIYSGLKDEDVASALTVLPKATCAARPNSPVGYYDIEVSGAESENYDITYTPGILTVKAAPLTIRPKDTSKVFGSPNPEFELSYLGFKNEDNESCLFRLPQISTTATEQSPVGSYPIIASNAAAKNYAIEYEQGVLTVTKNKLIVKVKDASRIYGDENPKFAIEYSGFLNGDTESIITTKPQIRTDAERTSKVGTYAITASGAASPNYDFDYQNGVLTINPRTISASVGNYSRVYGSPNPSFTILYAGFVNGDDDTSITEATVATCEANATSVVGTYPITLSGGRGENYEVTSFTNGLLTIEKADQTIEWNQDLSSVNQYEQVELAATSSSGLPITYEFADNNVVSKYTSGGKTILDCYGTGTVTLRATQPGNVNYNAAETVINRITVVSEGGYVDPSSPEFSINVTTAGTLSTLINANKKYQIKSLTVSGTLNGSDIRYLREMAGRDVYGSKTNGILEKLNLSRATIVSGGNHYYTTNSYTSGACYTANNQISDYMFYGCTTLTNLTLPTNTTKIGAYAFDGCINLTTIVMPDDIQSIGAYAFNGDISLTRISIPEQTVSIGNYAFQNCKGLSSLILGSSVKTIGTGMLNGCPNIQEITLNNSNAYFSTLNGVLYNKERTALIIYPAGKQLQTFEIPDGVTALKNSSFYGTSALKYLFFPESLTNIGTDAFKGCSNLSKLYARPTTPPTCAIVCFDAVSKSNCTLYVPRGSRNSYFIAPVWGDFLKIEESNDLSVSGNISKPDYGFEFTETTLNKGRLTYIPVSMNNVDPVVAFNCDIVLPDGVDVHRNADGDITFKLSERYPMSQNISSSTLPNGDIRIVSISFSNEAFIGTEGVLFYLPLSITDQYANENSEYILTVKNIEFSKKNQSGVSAVESPDVKATLTVGKYIMGDADGNGRVTLNDAITTRGYILGENPDSFIEKAADMDGNGSISVTDVTLIIDEVLAQNKNNIVKQKKETECQEVIQVVGTKNLSGVTSLNVTLNNAHRFTSAQMDLIIPEGFIITGWKIGTGNEISHNIKYLSHPDGLIRVIIDSDNNTAFSSDNLLTIEIEETNTVNNSQEFLVEDVLAVEITDRGYHERSIKGCVANISEISMLPGIITDEPIVIWTENSNLFIKSAKPGIINLYDIAGHYQPIEVNTGITEVSLVSGIYIINNKKIIIK